MEVGAQNKTQQDASQTYQVVTNCLTVLLL